MSQISVLLADDHAIIRDGIRALLEDVDDIQVIAEATNGKEAIQKLQQRPIDVMILDLSMPVMNGLEATKRVKQVSESSKILVLSMHDTEDYVLKSIEAGASGYLLKDTSKEEFVRAIYAVHQGEKYFSSSISHILVEHILNPKPKGEEEDLQEIPSLTKREKQILQLIKEGLSNKEIATALGKSVRTIETHRFNLMKKLQAKNVVELINKSIDYNLLV